MKTKDNFLTIVMAVVVVLGLSACQKTSMFDHELGLSARKNILEYTQGSTPVFIYSNTTWKAKFTSEVDWAAIDCVEGSGNAQINFSYAANVTGSVRSVGIAFEAGTQRDTILMIQQSQNEE